nr:hypothetical protein [Tanacetum cinerariifolium]
MEAQQEITQNISSLKLLMLKTGDYDHWSIRMEQYLTHTDYALWEVIINGDSPVPKPPTVGTVVYKAEIKGQSSSGSNSHNVAFVSFKNTSNINETVTAAHDIFVAGSKEQPSASSYADDVMFYFFASQSNNPQLDNEDLEQIDTDDLEEIDLKCIAFLKYEVQARDILIKDLKNQLEEAMKEKDDLKEKLIKFEESYKNLTKLINSQMSAKEKTGLGYDSQLSENEMPKCEIFETASDSSVSEIDEYNNQAKDRYKVGIGYHAVPPPYTRNYMPPRADLSFAGLDDSVFKFKISETRTSLNENESIASKSSEEIKEETKTVREVRPVWNNARRVNHQNFSKMTHPHPKRNFVPTAVATKSGQVLVNAAKQNSAALISTARPKRKQRKEVKTSYDESEDEDHVPTPSSDLLSSGEDRFILNELMVFCTSLQEQVLDLQEAKAAQAKEIVALKKKVSKLNKWKKSRSGGLRRLKRFGSVRRVKYPMEKDGLGNQKDASKQERMIEEIDQNTKIALDDETRGRTNNDEMFGVNDLAGEEVVVETTTGIKDSVAPTTDVTEDEITMAQALGALKSVKPKMRIDEEYARKLQAEEQEEARLSRAQQDEEANNSWDNMQAMIDADRLLAERLQAREREEFSYVQKARLLVKQKVDENVEPVVDDSEELRKCIEIVPDDGDEVLIEDTPISSRSPTIIDYKIHKEGKKNYFKIIRADGNYQFYQTFEKIFKNFNREDLEVLWAIVKDRFKKEKPVDDMDNILFRTLKTMFEHHVEDTIWISQGKELEAI